MDTLSGYLVTRSVARYASDISLCGYLQQWVKNRRSSRSQSGAHGLADQSESREAHTGRAKTCRLRWQDLTRNTKSSGGRPKENASDEFIRGQDGNCTQ